MRIESRARARALQALYAWEMRGGEAGAGAGKNLDRVATQVWDDLAITPEERRLAGVLVRDVSNAGSELDSRLADLTTNWRLERLGAIEVYRTGTRHTYPFVAQRYYRRHLAGNDYDVVIEDLNKVPLYTPLWGLHKLVVLVHHLFGGTVFREASPPVAAAVWLSERPLGAFYRGVPFE